MPAGFADEDVARLRIALARIARVVDRTSGQGELTRTQLSVLGTVARLKCVPIGELADIEGLNPTMLSRTVGKLEADGLVSRAPSAEDRRAIQVKVTPAGRALHLRLRRLRTQLFTERLTELPAGRAAELLAALPALEALAEQMRSPLGPARERSRAGVSQ
ncbi:MAG: MarR family transcriptional regulator [Jatrophihabitantaceae bacterium]